MTTLGLALGALIGVTLGLLGGGGSILTVPVFVYLLQIPPKEAVAMSLPVVGIASAIGAARHWRAGNVALRTAIVFAAVAMVTAFAGARISGWISGDAQLVGLAIVMLAAAISMYRSGARKTVETSEAERISPALLAAAAGVGALTGIIGVGGGFLIVPALVILSHVPVHRAIGTSLLVIALNTTAAFAGQPTHSVVRWALLAAFTSAAVAGILVGSALAPRVPAGKLKRGFAMLLVAIAGFILYQSRVLV